MIKHLEMAKRVLVRLGSDEDQPGYGHNPTTLADPKQYRQVVKRYALADKALKTAERLKSQFERLRSYRHSDPEKAKVVAGMIVVQRGNLMNAAEAAVDHAMYVVREAKSKTLSPQEKHWVDFLSDSVRNTEKQMEATMLVTKGQSLPDIVESPLTISVIMSEMRELMERFKHTTGILSHILKD